MITVTILKEKGVHALEWVKETCPSYITNDMHMDGYNTYDTTKLDFFFSDQKDAVMFVMRWV